MPGVSVRAAVRPKSTFRTTFRCCVEWTPTQVPDSARWQARRSRSASAATRISNPALPASSQAFETRTGIHVELSPVDLQTAVSFDPVEPDRRPDVVVFSHEIPEWTHDRAIDIAKFVDPETLRSDFGDFLLGFGRRDNVSGAAAADEAVRAIPFNVGPKSLVFYPKAEFEKAGYQIPHTWADLLALSDRIVADGGTPWCFGFESGDGDRLARYRLAGEPRAPCRRSRHLRQVDPWRDRLRESSSDGGRQARRRRRVEARLREGRCDQHQRRVLEQRAEPHAGSRQRDGRDRTAVLAVPQARFHAGSSLLRPIRSARMSTPSCFLRSTRVCPLRSSVRRASCLPSPIDRRCGRSWTSSPAPNGARSGPPRPPAASYLRTSASTPRTTATRADPAVGVHSRLAAATLSALHSNAFRMDASDLMPAEIGGVTPDGRPGAFYKGMADWVDGTRTIEQVFADIDAAWAALNNGVSDLGHSP